MASTRDYRDSQILPAIFALLAAGQRDLVATCAQRLVGWVSMQLGREIILVQV